MGDFSYKVFKDGFDILYEKNCNNVLKKICSKYKYQEWTKQSAEHAILDLSIAILVPSCTLDVANSFPQLLLPILSKLLDNVEPHNHQKLCVVIGKLVDNHPDVLKLALKYFSCQPPPWDDPTEINPAVSQKKLKLEITNVISDYDIVQTSLNFLRTSLNHFRSLWNWSGFITKYLKHEDFRIRWLSCHCVAMVTGMDEVQRQHLVDQNVSKDQQCSLDIDKVFSSQFIDYRLRAITEEEENDKQDMKVFSSVVSVAGITLSVLDVFKQISEGCLILVPSSINNLKNAALGVACGKAVCLMGPVGCGKTGIVEHLAQVTGRVTPPQLLKVQLGDETDAKMLLGAYRCTDVPGEFVWQPGVLTQAVLGGHWLLLEDIDCATSDVVAVLSCLLETGAICVPGFKDNLVANPSFQLFFTYRLLSSMSGHHRKHSTASELLEKHWLQVNVEPLTRDELVHIIQVKFPVLKTIASRMVSLYLKFSVGEHEVSSDINKPLRSSGRLTSTRDLMKWCSRAEMGFDVSSPESALKVLQDAIDVFCCSTNSPDERLDLAKSVAACLGIIHSKAEYFCNTYKPNVTLSRSSCTAGRIILPVIGTDDPAIYYRKLNIKFALTRQASCLIERVAVCLSLQEPVLLVGETGTGKTSTLQLLAQHTGHTLVVVNMNQQSDSADLLGGFKPVDMKYVMTPVREEFESLFRSYFLVQPNLKFLEHISTCFAGKRWNTLLSLMKHSLNSAVMRLKNEKEKRGVMIEKWLNLRDKLHKVETQLKQGQSALAFTFVEGTLVRAVKEGHWVLLDEINLASAETLQCLSSLLEGGHGTLSLLERGDTVGITRHPQFRLMAAMNPATDVGKKDLPPGIRNRFTELFVDELTNRTDLGLLISCYLRDLPPVKVDAVVRFYLAARTEAVNTLSDATGHKPHYSLRTLCRALAVAANNPCGSVQRSLHAALCLSFLTQLDTKSHTVVYNMINKAILEKGDIKSVLGQPIPEPLPHGSHISFEGYWVAKGKHLEPSIPDKYILTPCVRRNLQDLVRAVSLSLYPVLLQGDTCVGKTSLITFLAQSTGNKCLRINNHEHTDLQEYIGAYCADPATGNLVFREGVLVQAMRLGYWIILDELNLAPTDVLEALNRVLDDNRELYIPETQETVRADPKFRLFATQNPPGLYGGRKVLSRAFRNRFIELHFNEIPGPELETILQQRCDMPASYCKKLIAVMSDLQMRRRGSAAFAGKQGFITLRDLFRWGERYRLAHQGKEKTFYDWDQHIADEGFLVLAGRVRKVEENEIINQVIEKHIKRKVYQERLFTLNEDTSPVTRHILETIVSKPLPDHFDHIVWTFNLRRLAVLVGKACEFQEPVLLVGETGCGKTTVCQLLAAANIQLLLSVNCHQHSESSDFLGALRPVRDRCNQDGSPGRLFEWVDGPLIEAMKGGHFFLADEISLADDSVLERLNSLLEPERTLLLSEKGAVDEQEVVAVDNFRFIGTMNPGGDFGKKELSPALRNRLTEIWCESISDRTDLVRIIEHNVKGGLSLGNQQDGTSGIGNAIMDFITWFKQSDFGKRMTVSVRDILTWVKFINITTSQQIAQDRRSGLLDVTAAYIHGACLTLLDGIGSGSFIVDNSDLVRNMRQSCVEFLIQQTCGTSEHISEAVNMCFFSQEQFKMAKPELTQESYGIPPFFIKRGPATDNKGDFFTLGATTPCMNALRLLRALQLPGKAILLEGSPGVGKTSLVAALAKVAGYPLTRINLSDQTDVSDLFGADLPVEGAAGGTFAWRDGPFLRALKSGHWILLDELNLASQSVLEGLNAVLDHRGELFIPELGKTFNIQPHKTRMFACQNPLRQGGARRGLPQSFLNRFTQVYMEQLTSDDLFFIANSCLHLPASLVQGMVRFNSRLNKECGLSWGTKGAPWEMNLRDLTRWGQAINDPSHPERFVQVIYVDRMRTLQDKNKVLEIYEEELGSEYPLNKNAVSKEDPGIIVTPSIVYFGDIPVSRTIKFDTSNTMTDKRNVLLVLRNQLITLRSLAVCVNNNWMSILVGSSGSGKTSVVRTLAQLCGKDLKVLAVNSAMDTTEILGGFEQADHGRHLDQISDKVERLLLANVKSSFLSSNDVKAIHLLSSWEQYRTLSQQGLEILENQNVSFARDLFLKRSEALYNILKQLHSTKAVVTLCEQLSDLQGTTKKTDLLDAQGDLLNAGGSFEWVDSVLVKCLQEGSWLLIDNVNLCSPAVLDRLNGLLEPNGELIIGERGVDMNGDLVTIKPHPDFRLFLTMNPQHGEISRAMRNRGVEICMLSPEESNIRSLDMSALMSELGLTLTNHQQAFHNVHKAMVDLVIGMDQPTTSHLLHAVSMTVQHWLRGQPLVRAFKSCCTDVYLKSRQLTSEQRERVGLVLKDVLKDQDGLLQQCKPTLRDQLTPKVATINTMSLQECSILTMVKQQGVILLALLKASLFSDQQNENQLALNDIFCEQFYNFDEVEFRTDLNVKLDQVLPYIIVSFYSYANEIDLVVRQTWIQHTIDYYGLNKMGDRAYKLSSAIFDILNNALKKQNLQFIHQVSSRQELPWDLRRVSNWIIDTTYDWSMENKLAALLYFVAQSKRDWSLKGETNKSIKRKNISALEFSEAFNKGEISELAVQDPIVTQLVPLLSAVDECVSLVLSSNIVGPFNTALFDQLLSVLRWRNRLHTVGLRDLFSKNSSGSLPVVSDLTLTSLIIHYKWLNKWLLPEIMNLVRTDPDVTQSGTITQLNKVVTNVDTSLSAVTSPLLSISKVVCIGMGQPKPLADNNQAEIALEIARYQKLLNVVEDFPNLCHLEKKVHTLVSKKGRYCRNLLANAEKYFQSENFTQASLLLSEIEQKYPSTNEEDQTSQTQEMEITSTSDSEINLWPLKSAISLQLNTACRSVLAGDKILPGDQEIILNLSNWSRQLLCVPSNIIGWLDSALLTSKSEDLASYRLMLTTELMQQFNNCPALKNPRMWLTWRSLVMKEQDKDRIYLDSCDAMETFSPQSPLVSVFVSCLIAPENQNSKEKVVALPSLQSYKDRTNLLNELKEIIWRNSPALATTKLNYSKNEEECVKNMYTNFIASLTKSLTSKGFLKTSDLNSKSEITNVEVLLSALKSCVEQKKSKQTWMSQSKTKDSTTDNLLQQIKDLKIILNQMKVEKNINQRMILIGQSCVFMGLILLIFFTCIDVIDPVYKNALKLEYATEELEDLKHILIVEELQGVVLGNNHFPYKQVFTARVGSLKTQEEKLKKYVAVRPDATSYTQLSKELFRLTRSICSPTTVVGIVANLENSLDDFNITEANTSLKEAEGWLNSVRFVYNSTAQYVTWFPDIASPVLLALTQLSHGVKILCNKLRKQILLHELKLTNASLHSMITPLSYFIMPEITHALNLVDVCTSKAILVFIEKARKQKCPEGTVTRNEVFRLSKCCLQELHNIVAIRGTLQDGQEWKGICQILDHVVLSWQHQEEVKKDKEKQEESLYINKARVVENLTEDEEIAQELSTLFPTYRDKDFGDLEVTTLEDSNKVIQENKEDTNYSLTMKDIKEIHRIHSEIVTLNTTSHWISLNKIKENVLDFVSPFAERFNVFGKLLDSFHEAFDSTLDSETGPGLCLAIDVAIRTGYCSNETDTIHRGKSYDFYRDANIAEVKKCIVLFEALNKRVGELLQEWPDHPTLNQITMIIQRILGFEATSPVSRFLTGLELLLTKLKEWEENAHAGVSLCTHSTAITHQIIAWRKLELTCWKSCLNSSAQRLCNDASKWWFHLYCTITSYLSEVEAPDKVMTDTQLVSSLENFMESSSMGEFQARLDLLYTFHCHAINLSGHRQEKLVSILWNLYQYYQQFSRIVSQRVKECAAPIEKKLRDFVKISRWNDINYWAVKATVEQTHRTLHKYIREYENILKQPARNAMTKLDQSHTNKNPPLSVEADLYLSSLKLKSMLKDKEIDKPSTKTESLLARELTLFNKARKLCRDMIVSCNLPQLIQSLNTLCDDIKETSIELNNTEVDETLPKEKQKSQAKNLLQRKRKALSDLFRTLADLGLSYRAGLIVCGDELSSSTIKFATLPPLDISAALTQIESRIADKELTAAWTGCDEYFLQSVAFLAQLDKALGKPHKDLGPPNIDRCRGFTNHLMKFCQDQKLHAADSVEKLYLLRCQTTELFNALPSNTELPKQSAQLDALKEKLHSVLDDSVFCLEQFQVFLDTCPEQVTQFDQQESIQKSFTVLSESVMGPLHLGSKGNSDWQSAKSKLNESIGLARKAKSHLQLSEKSCRFINQLLKTNQNLVQHHFNFDVTTGQYKAVKDGFGKLDEIKDKIIDVKNLFALKLDCGNVNPSNKSLEHLVNKINKCLVEFKKTNLFAEELGEEWSHVMTRAQTAKLTTEVIHDFETDVEILLNTMLIVIQEVYKRNIQSEVAPMNEANEDGNDLKLVDGHLKEKIVNTLFSEVKNLKLNEVTESLWKLIGKLSGMQNSSNRQACKKILRRCVPLLDQYSLLAQFIITQQVAALRTSSRLCSQLLTLCIDLANRGFRMPEELMEEGEGEGSQAGQGGMGLGEGEGKKDVSDQIESQDQLEDARPSGEEEKEEDKECKEEEKGIEMSDDFGGKLQDLDKKEDEDGSGEDSDKEEEPDKEMGDTEKGAETLDQEIWGSDSENEGEDEDDEKEEEKGDSGEQLGEKELGAHEDDKKTQDSDKNEEEKHQDDKKKEINEMDDQEVDDDQIDAHHGKHEPQPEPEPLDLPEDLNLDDEQKDGGEEDKNEENPFDIDEMKEQMPPPEDNPEGEDKENDEKENKEEELNSDSSDDEGDKKEEQNEEMDVDQETEENQDESQDDGGAKSDEKTGEEPKPDETPEEREDETAKASEDKPSNEPAVSSNQETGSKDEVSQQPQDESDSKKMNPEDSSTAEGPDQQGVGSAQQEKEQDANQGSKGSSKSAAQSKQNEGREEKRQRPGESEEERALGNFNEPLKKKLKTMKMDKEGQEETQEDESVKEDPAAELYQHIKEAKESSFDAQTLDAATEEQAQQQPVPKKEDEAGEELEDDSTIKMDEDEPLPENEIAPKKTADKLKEGGQEKNSDGEKNPKETGDGGDIETGIEVEGDLVETMTVRRGDENTFHTSLEDMEVTQPMSDVDIVNLRSQLEQQLATWSQPPLNEEAVRAWETLTNVTSSLSRDLSEQLRLVLEPTHASRLKGDFRTGRRINMRKVIPYIASQFRKDKIWLRRTKPSKREYQIILAIDDSSSMADNHSKELAFESLAVVSKALTLLEAGELSVLSFGETPKVLHQLGEPFMEQSGARLLQQFSFEQQKTQVGALVDFACNILARAEHRSSSDIAQLLVVISDGRGVLNEGEEQVRGAVRRARLQGILMVFVIVDNPDSKDSILDIRMPRFSGGKLLGISPYMDSFPFPFYLILRDINNLPSVLSDALRQWFELVTNMT